MKKLMFLMMLFALIIITAESASAQNICSKKSDGKQIYVEIANMTNKAFTVNLVDEKCKEVSSNQQVPSMEIFSRVITDGQAFRIREDGTNKVLHQFVVNPEKPIVFIKTDPAGSKISVRDFDVISDDDFQKRADAAFAAVKSEPESSSVAQTRISFAKGASEKTISVTLAAGASKSFVLAVDKKQSINANALIKSDDLILFSFGLENANDSIDNWEDYEGGLTVLTGKKGDYIFSVTNNTEKPRTFQMKVRVGPAGEYDGGISNK